MNYGKIEKIEEVQNAKIGNKPNLEGKNGSRLGFSGMLSYLVGYQSFDGYQVKTDKHTISVLIENGQSCCEDWGYFELPDETDYFIGAELLDVELTDTALDKKSALKKMDDDWHETIAEALYKGGIQFVDFKTTNGTFQLAVYNSHNGYYGHGIIVAIDEEIICDEIL